MNRTLARLVLLVWACGGLAGCASGPRLDSNAAQALLHDTAFAPWPAVLAADEIFALSPAMQQAARSLIATPARQGGMPQALFDALNAQGQLRLAYDAEHTRTAAEAFAAQAGNCLSLVIMTGAMADALGLAVRYQSIETTRVWDRVGDLLLNIGHVNVSIGRPAPMVRFAREQNDWLTIDFTPPAADDWVRSTPIDQRRVVALFMNNRAAESLAGGDMSTAYAWARAAVLQDSQFADAFNTLGVVYSRRQEPKWAEAALRQAVALAPGQSHVLGNLLAVLQRQNVAEQAGERASLQARLQRLQTSQPFALFDEGMAALRSGDNRRARELLTLEVRRTNGHHAVHFGLARAYLNLGDAAGAARHLQLARENSSTPAQQGLYAAKLRGLNPP